MRGIGPASANGSRRPQVAPFALFHLVVDLACVATMLGRIAPMFQTFGPAQRALSILVYDMVAFCLQLPLGAALDALGRRWSPAATRWSLDLVLAGVVFGRLSGATTSVLALLFVAVGNALFHCAGGVEVLGDSAGRAAPAGMFISTGAVGVFLGSLPALNSSPLFFAILVFLLLACLWATRVIHSPDTPGDLDVTLPPAGWAAVALLAATVALRSYTGAVMAFPWKAELALAACSTAAVVAGKALGGHLSDRVGPRIASAISLGCAAPQFLPSFASVPAGMAATLLFNLTMAITLSALSRLLPRARGLAFGIASFALAIGVLPALLGLRASSGAALCALSLVSLALLEAGIALSGRVRQPAPGEKVRPSRECDSPAKTL